jgi:hypothetical protein
MHAMTRTDLVTSHGTRPPVGTRPGRKVPSYCGSLGMGAAVVVHSVDRPAGNLDDLRCPVVSRRIFRSLTTGVA